ncbi:Hypothetical protein A7982_00390 [Minicystis rosea]|nr:Hypothetical protein A7982_00390 [Minicystis rosea]
MLLLAVAICGWSLGCDLLLGELPPVKVHHDGGAGGSGGTGTTASSGGAPTTSATSSSAASGGSSSSGGCCDCDGDHVNAIGPCGGTDCDDHNPLAYPGEPVFYAEANDDPAIGFDWDCNGQLEQNPDLLKTVDCGLLGLPCASGEGYLATVPPACGKSAPWGKCKQNGLGCVPMPIVDRVMTCR